MKMDDADQNEFKKLTLNLPKEASLARRKMRDTSPGDAARMRRESGHSSHYTLGRHHVHKFLHYTWQLALVRITVPRGRESSAVVCPSSLRVPPSSARSRGGRGEGGGRGAPFDAWKSAFARRSIKLNRVESARRGRLNRASTRRRERVVKD